jgi:hypothetical protein
LSDTGSGVSRRARSDGPDRPAPFDRPERRFETIQDTIAGPAAQSL